MTLRIALIGTGDSARMGLSQLLRSNGFDVDFRDPGGPPSLNGCRMDACDVVIAGADLAAHLEEETLFTSLLAAPAFLIYDEKTIFMSAEPPFLIHAGMSPETVISRINNAAYSNARERKYPRIRVDLPVEYEYDEKRRRSAIVELGGNGMFIRTLDPPPDGTRITMTFSVPGTGRQVAAFGRSVYSIGCDVNKCIITHPAARDTKIAAVPGVGVELELISPDDRKALIEFVRRHS